MQSPSTRIVAPVGVGVLVTAICASAQSQVITPNITVPAPMPGLPLQTWVDVNPALAGIQRCTVETTAGDQMIDPPVLPPLPCDLVVDVRLMNAMSFPVPGMRMTYYHFSIVYDPSVVAPAPGLVNAPTFGGFDPTPGVFIPPGSPPGLMRVTTAVMPCLPGGALGGVVIGPTFNMLMARCGFNFIGEGQSGFDVTDIEIGLMPNSLPCTGPGPTPGDDFNARSQIIRNYSGLPVGCWTVNRPFDAPDMFPGNGISDSNPMLGIVDSTLSACITEANLRTGVDGISFEYQPPGPPNEPPPMFVPGNPPALTDSSGVFIDGLTQPGTELMSGGAATCFNVISANNVIRSLSITNFSAAGVTMSTAAATNNAVRACRIGLNWFDVKKPNWIGVVITDGASSNTIGSATAGQGNVISGNTLNGVSLTPGPAGDAPNNRIIGNRIGTDAAGLNGVPNGVTGVSIVSVTGTEIGGDLAGEGNQIAANTTHGVSASSGAANTVVAGNWIGIDSIGANPLANGSRGIRLVGVANVMIGGDTPDARNVISGNAFGGIELDSGSTNVSVLNNTIGLNPAGTTGIGNGFNGVAIIGGSDGNHIGAVGDGNVISDNGIHGVFIEGGSDDNEIFANRIGTDAAGDYSILKGGDGVHLDNICIRNKIGAIGAGNLISGNGGNGVTIQNAADENTVKANVIGLNASQTASIANTRGVRIDDCTGNHIGGGVPNGGLPGGDLYGIEAEGNVIAGNTNDGVLLVWQASQNVVARNWIGSNASGVGIANVGDGVDISLGAYWNEVAFNHIWSNANHGVYINGTGCDDNVIASNDIGRLQNPNLGNGIVVIGAKTTGIANNVIEGNLESGIHVDARGTSATTIFGNNCRLNQAFGVLIEDGADTTILMQNDFASNGVGIGEFGGAGTQAIENNIAGNTDAGVLAGPIRLSRNSIYDNGALGIEIENPPAFVTIDSVSLAESISISGTLTGQQLTEHTIEAFNNLECDASGFGEGRTFLGDFVIVNGADGTTKFVMVVAPPPKYTPPLRLSLTATRVLNSTSGFSNCYEVTGGKGTPCPADLNNDGQVGGADLAIVLGQWLTTGPGDINGDGIVNGADIALILGSWGPCPE